MVNTAKQANNRIAKNTVFLYVRKFLSLIIAFYTSRVLLQTLGVDDFGLYGLVGSIVVLFNSLRSMFASSIQRYLNVEKNGSEEAQNRIFSMGVTIQVGIAVIFFIVVEIAGLIMLPNLNFEPDKVSTAGWVLQFSILSAVVSILTVPYDALMMAKERFDAIAIFSLIESVMRLGVIYLLLLTTSDRVVYYAILLFGLSIFIRMINAMYCKRKFSNIAKYHRNRDKALLTEMTKFAGWNFFGNLGYSLTNQGLNFILNLFGGVVANAGRTIAYQVNDNMRSFVVDIAVAFTPQSMMTYHENRQRFYNLQFFSAKASSAIFLVFVFPIYVLTQPVLELWLGECPLYAVQFIHGIIFYSMVRNWHGPIDIAFKSANRMKYYQLCEIGIMILNLPVSWIVLHFGAPLYSIFIVMTVCELINLMVILLLARRQIDFPVMSYLKSVVGPVIFAVAIFAVGYCFFNLIDVMPHNIFELLLYGITGAIISILVNAFVVLNHSEREKILGLIIKRKKA